MTTPDWLVTKLRAGAEREFPWPLAGIDNWFCGYLTYEAGHVYQVSTRVQRDTCVT